MKVDVNKLTKVVNNQLLFFNNQHFIDKCIVEKVLNDIEPCFINSPCKYFYDANEIVFNEDNSVQYSIFLWNLSKQFNKMNEKSTADKIYYLNKMLNGVDWYHEIDLPKIWGCEHPVGSVLGRAKYNDGLFLYQGTTIGGSNNFYPELGKNIIMYSNSSILGKSHIGNNVIIATGVTILNYDVPDNCLVFQKRDELMFVKKDIGYIQEKMSSKWKKQMFNLGNANE